METADGAGSVQNRSLLKSISRRDKAGNFNLGRMADEGISLCSDKEQESKRSTASTSSVAAARKRRLYASVQDEAEGTAADRGVGQQLSGARFSGIRQQTICMLRLYNSLKV